MEAGRLGDSPVGDMPTLLADGETWLVERVQALAAQHGYAARIPAGREPWRLAVVGLRRALTQAWPRADETSHEGPLAARCAVDPLVAFAEREAGRHRQRGLDPAWLWALFKDARQAHLELLAERLPPGAQRQQWAASVGACFERLEAAFVRAWTAGPEPAAAASPARANRQPSCGKDSCLAVLESLPHAVFWLTELGLVAHGNAAAVALAGPSGDAGPARAPEVVGDGPWLGKPLGEVLPWLAPALTRFADREGLPWEDVVVEPGQGRSFRVSIHPVRDVSGLSSGRLVLCRDVTADLRAEVSLRQLEERYRTLVDLMHQGLAVFSPGGGIDYANDTLCAMLGLPASEVIGRPAEAFVRAEDRERFAAEQRARREGRAEPYEMGLRGRDGRALQVMASPSPVMGPDGEFQGSLEVLTDVSRLRELEMRLTTAKRLEAIGQLAGGVAHEINTPLQYVSGNLDFALTNLPRLLGLLELYETALRQAGDAEALARARADIAAYGREYDLETVAAELPQALADSLAGAQRVAAFVRSIKRFAQSGTEGRRVIDVAEALATAVEVARSAIPDAAALEVELVGELPPLSCVPGDFNQLLLCLILNAAQAVEEAGNRQGRVVVTARRLGRSLEVAVRDNGTGIPAAIREKIFNPFFTTKDVGQGTGQGLSIALSIVQKHRGTIRFETEPGRGTTFYVTFPVDETA